MSERLPTMRWRILLAGLLVLLLAVTAACGPSAESPAESEEIQPTAETLPEVVEEEPVQETVPAPAEESYPPPPPTAVPPEYPAETAPPPTATPVPDVYPPPVEEEVFAEPRIQLDLPVAVGDATISGTAPAGLALAAVDVTYNGALLGTGTTGSDGRFTIPVEGLIEGNRLGLTFNELEPGLSLADMSIKYFPHRGDNFMNLPNVGVMLDTTLIQP